jgi:hypothetical protein
MDNIAITFPCVWLKDGVLFQKAKKLNYVG